LVAWKTGVTPRNAETIVAIAQRLEVFPRCAEAMREGRLSVDQVGVIAERAADGSDEHYVGLAEVATVNQLRTAVKLEPRPEPKPKTEPQRTITRVEGEHSTTWRITLPRVDAAKFEAGLQSHRDALIADWKSDHAPDDERRITPSEQAPPFPDGVTHSWRSSRRGGTRRWPGARMASTPPWSCISMARRSMPPCISARY
jgi:hypothetical protein